jgi:hypothetical protein
MRQMEKVLEGTADALAFAGYAQGYNCNGPSLCVEMLLFGAVDIEK